MSTGYSVVKAEAEAALARAQAALASASLAQMNQRTGLASQLKTLLERAQQPGQEPAQNILKLYRQRTDQLRKDWERSLAGAQGYYESSVLPFLQARAAQVEQKTAGLDDEEMRRIAALNQARRASAVQQMTTSGMMGSTVMPTLLSGIRRQEQEEMAAARARQGQLGLEAYMSASGDVARAMEGRAALFPKIQELTQVALPAGEMAQYMQRAAELSAPSWQLLASLLGA